MMKCSLCSDVPRWFCLSCKFFLRDDCYEKEIKQLRSCFRCVKRERDERMLNPDVDSCKWLCCYSVHSFAKKLCL